MRRLLTFTLAWLAFSAWSGCHAQTYPNRPIRLIVPFPPGGATDANARALAKEVELPRLREFFLTAGYEPTADPPVQFQQSFQADIKRWGEIVRLAKILPE